MKKNKKHKLIDWIHIDLPNKAFSEPKRLPRVLNVPIQPKSPSDCDIKTSESRLRLYLIMDVRKMEDENGLVQKGLEHFKKSYQPIPIKQPCISDYYDLFTAQLSKGESLEMTAFFVELEINRRVRILSIFNIL